MSDSSSATPPSLMSALEHPKVKQALALLHEVRSERCDNIDSVTDADPNREEAYQDRLSEYAQLRGGALYYPYISSGQGNGPWVKLSDGSTKLDFITGIGVHGLGHSHPALLEAGVAAALMDTVMQGNLQQFDASVDLSRRLVDRAQQQGAKLPHVTLSTSGAMANENSLKLAFHARPGTNRILAFEHCFAGRTLALSRLTDKAAYRVGLPPTLNVDYLPFHNGDAPIESLEATVKSLKTCLERYPTDYAALWIELIQGEGGYKPGEREFFVTLLNIAREHKIPIIFDEVQTFARTSKPFAFQHFGLDEYADIVTIGKISQVCATLYGNDFKPKPGLISQTFTGGTWEILASLTTLDVLEQNGNFGSEGRNMQIFERFVAGFERLAEKYPGEVHGPWGLGGMVAMTPMQGTPAQAKRLAQLCYEEGLMAFVAGSHPSRIRFLPPLGVVTDEHIDLALDLLEKAFAKLLAEAQRKS